MRSVELIELGLNEVIRSCRVIDDVAIESRTVFSIQEAKGLMPDSLLTRMAEDHEELLKEVHSKVVDLLDMVGEYMNNTGMVTGVEVAISKPIYDLVYERKTEKDYEK